MMATVGGEDDLLLSLSHVSKSYGRRRRGVHSLTFSLRRGEKVGLLGLNGAGKSTTFRLITGLLSPDEGEIVVGGMDVVRFPAPSRRHLGYLPEHASLPLELSAGQVLRLEAELRGGVSQETMERVVQDCELSDVLNTGLKSLSRGFRKRVALASALISEPDLLLLDEPTAGLDPHQVEQFRGIIDHASRRCAVLISTHVLAEVEAICQRCVVLHEGELRGDFALPMEDDGSYEVLIRGAVRGDAPGAESLGSVEEGFARFRFKPQPSPEAWLKSMVDKGCEIRSFSPVAQKLEDVFLEMTQRQGSVSNVALGAK